MDDFSFELFLVGELRDVWQRVHTGADYDVVEFLSCLLGSLFVADVPTIAIRDQLADGRVEHAVRIDVFLSGVALDVRLNLWPSREIILVFVRLVPEPREFIEIPWDL